MSFPKDVLWVADFLRANVPIVDGVSMDKRCQLMHGHQAIDILSSAVYRDATKKLQDRARSSVGKKTLAPPVILEEKEAERSHLAKSKAAMVMSRLLEFGILRKAKLLKKKPIPVSKMEQAAAIQSGIPLKPSEEFILVVEPSPVNTWEDQGLYIWMYEGSLMMTYLYSFCLLLITLTGVMYPLWPYNLRLGVYYLSMVAVGLLGLLFVTAIIRLIMYVCTKIVNPKSGFWLFPNLFADCGFFESFVPFYSWEDPNAPPPHDDD